MKDCQSCPSFCAAADVEAILRKDPGADVCTRFGHILSRPSQTESANERVRIAFATPCESHGQPRPTFLPEQLSALVAIGDPFVAADLARRTQPLEDHQRPATCIGCKNFIPPTVVKRELGWTLGMCAAKGRLLFPTRYTQEAADCAEGERGDNRDTTDGPLLLPQYNPSVAVHVGGAKRRLTNSLEPAVDPRELETDKPVTDDDRTAGVCAWREVPDPEGTHPSQWWPVFDWKTLGIGEDPRSTYVNHKPELYLDHSGMMYDLVYELMVEEAVPGLIGGAGTGKTEAACWLAYQADLPFDLISMRDDKEVYEFIGETELKEAMTGVITDFREGEFTQIFQRPGIALIDEVNVAPEPIWHYLRPILLGATRMYVPQADRYIEKDYWRFLLSARNPEWDPRYIGTKTLSPADFERMSKLYIELPPENIEREIIRGHCRADGYELPESILDKIMQIAADLRRLSADGTLPVAWGVRPQIMVAKRTRGYSLAKAYRRAVTDGLEPSVAQLVADSVESIA